MLFLIKLMRQYVLKISKLEIVNNKIIIYNINNVKCYNQIFKNKIIKTRYIDHRVTKSVVNDNQFEIILIKSIGFLQKGIYKNCVLKIDIDEYVFKPYINGLLLTRLAIST